MPAWNQSPEERSSWNNRKAAVLQDPVRTGAVRHRVWRDAGVFRAQAGVDLKPLGDGFIKLVKMIIAPVIFCTVVHWHRRHAGHEEGRPRGRQGAAVLRVVSPGAGDRPGGGQRGPAGRRFQRRSDHPRHQGHRRLHRQGHGADRPPSSSSTSSPTPSWTPSPRATSCRCC